MRESQSSPAILYERMNLFGGMGRRGEGGGIQCVVLRLITRCTSIQITTNRNYDLIEHPNVYKSVACEPNLAGCFGGLKSINYYLVYAHEHLCNDLRI